MDCCRQDVVQRQAAIDSARTEAHDTELEILGAERDVHLVEADGLLLLITVGMPDLDAIGALGKPFWLAGGYGEPKQVLQALDLGATGVQVGTAFAYCNESGLDA